MSLPLKAGSATLFIGTVTGISSGIGAYFGKSEKTIKEGKSISDLIDQQYDYILLNTESEDSAWEVAWNKYEKQNTIKEIGKDAWQLKGWPTKPGSKLIEQLKQKCKSLSKENGGTIGDNLYKNLTNYCARGVTFEEKAVREGLRIVNANGDQNIWNNRQNRKWSDLFEDLKNLGVAGINVVVSPETIKKGCQDAKSKNKQEGRNSFIYSSYKKVCTKAEGEN